MADSSSTADVVRELRKLAGQRRPGQPMPSSREISQRLRVGPVTVSRAVGQLVRAGVLQTEPGRGTFVAAPLVRRDGNGADVDWQTVALPARGAATDAFAAHIAPIGPDVYALGVGYLDESLQPTRALAEAMARAARRPQAWQRPPLAGLPELRSAFAELAGVDASAVTVVGGGQSALAAAFAALALPGGPVVVESPTYLGALALLRTGGFEPVPVPTDDEGLRPELLADALATSGARVIYTQPTFANPTGVVTSPRRRSEILEVARDAGAFVIEDDYARLLDFDGNAPAPMIRDDADGHVVWVTSLTKPAAPSMRVGAIAARGPALERIRDQRLVCDLFVAQPMQLAAVELLSSTAWTRHLSALRRALAGRRDALVAELSARLPEVTIARVPRGGLSLWLRLPPGTDDREVAQLCALRGVLVSAGSAYFAGSSPAPHLRLTFCSQPEARLVEAVGVLADVLHPAGAAARP